MDATQSLVGHKHRRLTSRGSLLDWSLFLYFPQWGKVCLVSQPRPNTNLSNLRRNLHLTLHRSLHSPYLQRQAKPGYAWVIGEDRIEAKGN